MIDDHDLAEFFMMATGILLTTTIVFAVAWVRARERALRARIEQSPSAAVGDTRLDQLTMAVDTIAIELERVAEGQRFVTKLLADRVAPAPPRVGERSITPH
jgi:hypothetical protein